MNNLHFINCIAYTSNGIKHELFVRDGIISEKENDCTYSVIDAKNAFIIPGFIDTHIHGIGGFGTEDASSKSILGMSDILIKEGVTTFFPTVYTDTLERITNDERAIVEAIGKEKGSSIGGIHIEGPFISPNKIGAQNPEGRKDPDKSVMQKMLDAGCGRIKAMTVAPELDNIALVADMAKENGIVPLCGHTDATYEETINGSKLGIKHATHLFNAMSGLVHRLPGVVGAVISSDDMTAEIIMDGKHVHPASVRSVINAIGCKRVVCITDSLRPTRQTEGRLTANGVDVEMGDNLWVTKGRPELIQGSCLTMLQGFKNIIDWGYSMEEAIALTSTNPARIYSLYDKGEISVGKKADLLLLNSNFDVQSVYINGEARYVV